MHQLLISSLARLAIQPRNLLPTGVKITSNKNHKAPSVPRVSVLNQKLTRCGLEPSLLSNQSSRKQVIKEGDGSDLTSRSTLLALFFQHGASGVPVHAGLGVDNIVKGHDVATRKETASGAPDVGDSQS